MKKKILLGYRFCREGFESLEENFDLIYPDKEYLTKDEVLEKIPEFEVFVPSGEYNTDREIIDRGEKLVLIANYGAGYNTIDTDYAAQKGIVVINTPNSVVEPTAELAFGLLLATARRIPFYDRHLRTSEGLQWGEFDNMGTTLFGKILGIYGMGKIGQAIARRAVASGMKILYHNRKALPKKTEEKYGAQYVPFDQLLEESDFISLNAPATPESEHIINKDSIGKMKKSAILINAARGSLVDEDALIKALECKSIRGAGLDVHAHEPDINEKFKVLENVVLTPHVGTQTVETRLEMHLELADNIMGFFNNGNYSQVN